MNEALAWGLCGLVGVAALGVALSRKLLYAGTWLLLALLGVAVIMGVLGADFLATGQLVLYAGGILVLLLFGLMLTQGRARKGGQPQTRLGQLLPAALACLALGSLLVLGLHDLPQAQAGLQPNPHPSLPGLALHGLEAYLPSFELASLLLLVALLGALYVLRKPGSDP